MSTVPKQSPLQAWCRALPDTYRRWNEALADHFFCPENAGRPVYLTVDDEELVEIAAEAGLPKGTAVDSFVAAVQEVVRGLHGYQNVLGPQNDESAIYSYRGAEAQARQAEAPMFIALLALTVLAASRMGADESVSPHAFYARLEELLPSVPNTRNEFPRVVEGWKALNYWLDTTHKGRRGISSAREIPHFNRIGYPISQCALRIVDRRKLPYFFQWARYRPGHQLHPKAVEAALTFWTNRPSPSLTARGIAAVKNKALRPDVLDIVAADLARWDGSLPDGDIEGSRGSVTTLRATLVFRPPRPPHRAAELRVAVAHYLSAPPTIRIAGQELTAEPGARWYSPTLPCPTPPTSAEWRTDGSNLRVRFELPDIVVLTEDRDEARWCAVPQLDLDTEAIVLSRASRASAAADFLTKAGAAELQPFASAPHTWVGFQDVVIVRAIPTDDPSLECLSPLSVFEVSLTGGLPLGKERWLLGAAPVVSVQLPELDTDRAIQIAVDGIPRGALDPSFTFDLATLNLGPGPHSISALNLVKPFVIEPTTPTPSTSCSFALGTVLGINNGRTIPTDLDSTPTDSPTPGLIYIRGAEVVASSNDFEDLAHPIGPLDLSPCASRYIVLGRTPGEVIEITGHTHYHWPLRAWDICTLESYMPPFRPQWLARRGHHGRWSIRLIGSAGQPHQRLPEMSDECVTAWARALTRSYDNKRKLDRRSATLLNQYRNVAREMLK